MLVASGGVGGSCCARCGLQCLALTPYPETVCGYGSSLIRNRQNRPSAISGGFPGRRACMHSLTPLIVSIHPGHGVRLFTFTSWQEKTLPPREGRASRWPVSLAYSRQARHSVPSPGCAGTPVVGVGMGWYRPRSEHSARVAVCNNSGTPPDSPLRSASL